MPLPDAAALSPNGFPTRVDKVDATADRIVSTYVLGALLAIASVYAVPQAINPNLIKFGLAAFEVMTILFVARVARFHGRQDLFFFAVVAAAIASKTVYGTIVANTLWSVPVLDALIEARFGVALCALPLIIRLFSRASRKEIECLLIAFTVSVVVLDLIAVIAFPNLLSFGQRGADRFVISMMGAAGIAYFYLSKSISVSHRPYRLLIILISVWLLHVFIITTSRADSAVLAGLMVTTLLSMARIRQNVVVAFLTMMVPVLFIAVIVTVVRNDTIGGRDLGYFVRELTNSFPTGVGFLPDSTRNSSVVHFTPIFASDYGVGLYIYRYGLLSVGVLAALGFVVVQGIRGALRLDGAPVFLLAVLAYILVIPFWEYGALNGAFLTAALLFLPRDRPSTGSTRPRLSP